MITPIHQFAALQYNEEGMFVRKQYIFYHKGLSGSVSARQKNAISQKSYLQVAI